MNASLSSKLAHSIVFNPRRDFFLPATSPMVPEPCIFSLALPPFPLLSQCLYLLNSELCGYFILGLGSCRHNEDHSESYQGTFLNNSIIFVCGILSPVVRQ